MAGGFACCFLPARSSVFPTHQMKPEAVVRMISAQVVIADADEQAAQAAAERLRLDEAIPAVAFRCDASVKAEVWPSASMCLIAHTKTAARARACRNPWERMAAAAHLNTSCYVCVKLCLGTDLRCLIGPNAAPHKNKLPKLAAPYTEQHPTLESVVTSFRHLLFLDPHTNDCFTSYHASRPQNTRSHP